MTEMKFFGSAHSDDIDSPAHFTHMVVNSDLPIDYHPGRFHILSYGVYVTTSNNRCICFSGLLRHGGSSPTAPFGQQVRPDATRVALIFYVAYTMLTGTARLPICALPRGRMLKASQEMININVRRP